MNYHPDIELLLKYSNGLLKPALSIAIGLHHHQCKKCQASIADIESIAGNQLDGSVDAELADNGFSKLMGELENEETSQQETIVEAIIESKAESNIESQKADLNYDRLAVAQTDLSLLSKLDKQDFEDTQWQKVTGKISQSEILLGDDSFKVELLKFKPHAKIPQHTHKGNEFTLVVQGSFRDCYGEYQRGEFIQMGQENEHQPIAGEMGCICLAVTDKPLHFTGLLGPIINWMSK